MIITVFVCRKQNLMPRTIDYLIEMLIVLMTFYKVNSTGHTNCGSGNKVRSKF